MAEISPSQVHGLLTATQDFNHAAEGATQARDHLDHLFLEVARAAKVGPRELAAVTGFHPSTIRAAIRRAVGPGLPSGTEQPSLFEFLEALEPMRPLRHRHTPLDPANAAAAPAPTMAL